MSVYAYVCATCRHLSSEHRLRVTADPMRGPYDCLRCDCATAPDGPVLTLDRDGYEVYRARFGDPPQKPAPVDTEPASPLLASTAHSPSSGSGVHAANKFPAKDDQDAVSRPPVAPAPLPE